MEKQELRRQFGIADDAFVFVYVGRNSPRKQQPLLMKAFKEVRAQHPEAILLLGCAQRDGYDLRDVLDYYQLPPGSLMLTDNQVMHGHGLTDGQVANLYQASDCFVSPCVGGGFELCHLESMACGIPQIGVQGAGSIEEMVAGHGIVVSAEKWWLGGTFGDFDRPLARPSDLASAMRSMMHNPSIRKDWAEAALAYAQKDCFNWDRAAESFSELIRKVMLDTSTICGTGSTMA
jgi:glycosyltransferase involved in cell wall biosynthesis